MINNLKVLQSIIQSSAEGIIISNKQGEILLTNPRSEQLFGYDNGELQGQKVEVLLPESLKEKHQKHRQSFNQNPRSRSMGQGLDLFGTRKDGSTFPLEVSLSHSFVEGELFIIAFVIDITERKHNEQMLLESEEKLRYFVQNTPVAIAMTDVDMRYILLSARWLKEQHKKAEQLIGQKHQEAYPNHQDHWNDAYLQALSGEVIRREEEMIQRNDGSQDWLRWEVHPWRNTKGQIGGTLIFIEDITKRKIAELALKESKTKLKKYNIELERSNKELEEFAHIASHDLQEPLRKIQTFASMLRNQESGSLSPKGADYLERMVNSANRMKQLITDLLAFSRLSTKGKPFEKVALQAVLEEVLYDIEVSILKSGAKVEVVGTLPHVRGDRTQLRQLLQNLISNAIKFRKPDTPPKVTISSELVNRADMEYYAIKVQDNGIGFDQKFSSRIFNIFQRLEGKKYEGSGIGLSICKKIANRHGGDVTVNSKQGQGSEFTITMPVRFIEKR